VSEGPSLDPTAYRRWYESTLGSAADADEKDVVFGLAALEPGERILDLGCGDGNYTRPAAERADLAVGVDRSRRMLHAAHTRLASVENAALVQGEATSLPFKDASFDVVIAVTVLCFSPNPQALLHEALRVLRPRGRLVLGELGRFSVWAFLRRLKGLFRRTIYRSAHFFGPGELVASLRAVGFVRVVWRGAVLYPPVTWSRALQVLRHVEPAARQWVPWTAAFLVVRGERDCGVRSG
jgi:SAM-dependent methyltransferase